jgi:hypothetical protein
MVTPLTRSDSLLVRVALLQISETERQRREIGKPGASAKRVAPGNKIKFVLALKERNSRVFRLSGLCVSYYLEPGATRFALAPGFYMSPLALRFGPLLDF